jgi:hypothetical protein
MEYAPTMQALAPSSTPSSERASFLLALLVAVATLSLQSAAHAHGAFPQVRQLARDPSAPSRLWARATYGVLRSDDLGATWMWLCTGAAGYGPAEQPAFGVTSTGQVLSGVFDGLLGSKDLGCTWAVPRAELAQSVTGLAIAPGDPGRVLVLFATGKGDGTFQNDLWGSEDGGETFTEVALDIDPTALLISVAVAPSDPKRIYLAGLLPAGSGLTGGLLRSDDAGKTWVKRDLGTPAGVAPTLLGVHPENRDQLYLKVGISDGLDGGLAEHALRHSLDGGDTTQELLRKNAQLLGFAFSPNGADVFVGFGDPKGAVKVSPSELGLYRSSVASLPFTKVHDGHVGCVSFVGLDLWACLSQFQDGFEIGRSSDGGKTFTGVMQLSGVEPLSCAPPTQVAVLCGGPVWSDVCADVGKCSGGAGSGGQPDGRPAASDGGGCACRSERRPVAAPALAGALALLGATLIRRRAGRCRAKPRAA